jgi:bifunctional DNA-binding transcriptional regulator/antitoxin component of YhaV-PrlF toxin-antitoxin module
MGEQTTLTLATTGRDSMRTTVPMSIIRHFKLRPGDKLDWDFEINNGEIIILVRPEKNPSGNVPVQIREQARVLATRGKCKS